MLVRDDAGGGRRGRRPALTSELLRAVAQAYGISVRSTADLGGSVNLNVLVETADGRCVLRSYRRHAGVDRVRAIQHARAAIAAAGIPATTPLETLEGNTLATIGEMVVELEPFVASDEKMDVFPRVQAALPTLGGVHDVLRTLDLGGAAGHVEFTNHVAPTDLVDRVARGTDRIREWHPTASELAIADTADDLAQAVAAAEAALDEPPPAQLVHGDFWDDNVLFRDGEVVLVTDLDFMARRPRIDDLALILFYTRYVLAEPSTPETLAPLLAAYDCGTTTKLSDAERAALPVAMARQPLWSLAVWVALLDDEATARRHLADHLEAVRWGREVLDGLDQWQGAFS